jgi:hypothetical protein
VSGELSGETLDVRAVTGNAGSDIGVLHGDLLVAFAEACVGGDDSEIARTRVALTDAAGAEALVEAAATIGNFERMVRIADGTGIPLDSSVRALSYGLEEELDLVRFGSASNTPERSTGARLVQTAIGAVLHGGLRLAGRIRSR